jgi:6-pyruvoyltetrahydropterin/6-carboxytetrahydropterin synthase
MKSSSSPSSAPYIVRIRMTFCCALRLYVPELSDEENYELFGPCSWPSYHGHNYDLEVAVAGDLDERTGMVVDFSRVQKVVKTFVFDALDHRNLNTDVPWLTGLNPTTEVLCKKVWEVLENEVRPTRLHSITIGERDTNIVTYFGPPASAPSLEETPYS